MKVLLINNLYTPHLIGGAERSVQALAEALVDFGINVSVVSLAKEDSTKNMNGVKIHYVKLDNIHWPFGEEHSNFSKLRWHINDRHNWQMAKVVGEIIEAEKPDIVHTNNLS